MIYALDTCAFYSYYRVGDEKQQARSVFLELIEKIYCDLYIYLESYIIVDGMPALNKKADHKILYADCIKSITHPRKNAKQRVNDRLSVDSYFTNREYREDMAKHLREKFYSEIQIDFLIFSAERWLNSTSKKKKDIDKNDFFDMYFLGCLNKSADMNAYLKIREPGKYNVLDYRIAAISFDGAIKGFLENHHPLSYAEIQRFYM